MDMELRVFCKIYFFGQLLSALRLWALFPLRKFCSVADLKRKLYDRLVCLDFLFDKNRCYENVWDRVFVLLRFFEMLLNFFSHFSKN